MRKCVMPYGLFPEESQYVSHHFGTQIHVGDAFKRKTKHEGTILTVFVGYAGTFSFYIVQAYRECVIGRNYTFWSGYGT